MVRITTSYSSFDEDTLMPLLGEFLRKHTKIDLEINFEDQPIDIIKEGYDISIRPFPSRSRISVSRRLMHFPVILVASPDYLQRKGIPRSIEDLESHEWIDAHPPWRSRVKVELEPPTFPRRSDAARPMATAHHARLSMTGHSYVVASSAVAGIGIALMSSRLALPHLRTGKLKVVLPNTRVKGEAEIFVEYPNRRFIARKVRTLLDFLTEQLARSPDTAVAAELRRYAAT